MLTIDRTFALARANLLLFGRDPGPLLGRIVQPLLLIMLLHPLYVAAMGDTAAGTAQVVLGQLVMFSLLAMSLVGTSILTERRWQTFDRLRASPARAVELVAGKLAPALLVLVIQQGVVFFVGIAVLDLRVRNYGLLLLADGIWVLTITCLGAAIAMLVRSLAQFTAVVDIGSTVLAGLSGALVPLTSMPSFVQAVAPLWPGYWAMAALRGAADGEVGVSLTAIGVLGGVAAVAAAMAVVKLRRGWGRAALL